MMASEGLGVARGPSRRRDGSVAGKVVDGRGNPSGKIRWRPTGALRLVYGIPGTRGADRGGGGGGAHHRPHPRSHAAPHSP